MEFFGETCNFCYCFNFSFRKMVELMGFEPMSRKAKETHLLS